VSWKDAATRAASETLRQLEHAGIRDECFRVVDRHVAGFVAERYGQCLWIAWYRPSAPGADDIAAIESLAQSVGCRHWLIDQMLNRGSTPNESQRVCSPGFPQQWVAQEGAASYVIRCDRGQAPGLFLDQSANRRQMAALARDSRVLNLFAYTCSFSVVAALGQASQTISVDASRPFLEWGEENFRLNGLERPRDVLWKGDVRDYLKLARKRAERFDVIVLDPPTFSRSRKRPFNVRNDLGPLAQECLALLSASGSLLISTNLGSWSRGDLQTMLASIAPGKTVHPSAPPIGITDLNHAARSFWISGN
jgi:23S rRNA G2069 N7-methylase RlmK/C1962 C5-methylase RlmI